MSRKTQMGSELKQPSLLGFVSKKATIDDANTSPSTFSSHKQFVQSVKSSASSVGTATATSKFKYVPVKRKSESLIEISDDSRSPIKFQSPKPKRTHRSDSDDDIFNDFNVNTSKQEEDDFELAKKLAAVYAKYDSPPKKQPTKATAVQLTPEDKFDLDKALNSNNAYVNAKKMLDDNLQQVQQNTRIPATKTGNGKFKFNTRTSSNRTNNTAATTVDAKPAASTNGIQTLSSVNGSSTQDTIGTLISAPMQSMAKPANIVGWSPAKEYPNTKAYEMPSMIHSTANTTLR